MKRREGIEEEEMVGASGFEPPASWSRTRRASFRKDIPDNNKSETQELRPFLWMWPDVSGCERLTSGSLQKPLQSVRALIQQFPGANWPPTGGVFQS
jgi:hypothetical protein